LSKTWFDLSSILREVEEMELAPVENELAYEYKPATTQYDKCITIEDKSHNANIVPCRLTRTMRKQLNSYI